MDINKIEDYVKRYIWEVVEIVIAVSIIVTFSDDKKFDLANVLKISAIIAIIAVFLDEYNSEYKKTLKSSLVMTMCTVMIK